MTCNIRTLTNTLVPVASLAAGLFAVPAFAADPGPPLSVIAIDASSNDGNLPVNAIDGKLSTRWSGDGDGAWLRLRFDTSRTIGSLAIAWHQGDTRRASFDVQTSPNGSTWNTVYRGVSSGTTLQPEFYPLTKTTASYLRIVGHGNTYNDWNSVAETAAYAGTTNTPACAVPADVLDLTNWKITLPIDDPNKPETVALEIKQPALDSYKIDPWFVVTPNCDGVRFRAPVDGVTTSGSPNPRSELREMTNSGTSNAAWSSSSGTHTMTIRQAVTRLPSGDRPYIVVGQIHDASDDVTVFRVEGSKLYVTNGDTTHYKLVTDNFKLNTPFEVKFVVNGDKTKAYYNGVLQTTLSKHYTGAYFKAGAYTQANCDNIGSATCDGSNYGESVIYDVSVSHN